jgi:SHS2 domain-containing protein
VQFLNDLNFLLNTRKWIFATLNKVNVLEQNGEFLLNAVLAGEPFLESRHHLKEEIKSVTYHQMEIKKEGENYFTRIVFDI